MKYDFAEIERKLRSALGFGEDIPEDENNADAEEETDLFSSEDTDK